VSEPLTGIRVVDFSRALAGPFCAQMLGDMGADVVKIEARQGGDDSRGWGPPFMGQESTYFFAMNRNKRSMTLDLKKGKDIAERLLARADVVVENFSPGTMARLGLGYEQVKAYNPRVVYCSISGYGQTGPGSSLPGYDMTAQGASGLMSVTGHDQPTRMGVSIADQVAGMFGAFAVVSALYSRRDTGQDRGRLLGPGAENLDAEGDILAQALGEEALVHSHQRRRMRDVGQETQPQRDRGSGLAGTRTRGRRGRATRGRQHSDSNCSCRE